MSNSWFETVAVAKRRARKRLPSSIYRAVVAGSERGQTYLDNVNAFAELGLTPHVISEASTREQATSVMGVSISLPVILSPAGVQALHPEGEVAAARAATARGTVLGLSSFASRSIEDVCDASPSVFFQMYWMGTRDQMLYRMERARAAGAKALILTTDWSFAVGRDWGSPVIPEKLDVKAAMRFAPEAVMKPKWLMDYLRTRQLPDLTAPNLAESGKPAPTFFGAYFEWKDTPRPSWEDVAWLCREWNGPFMLKGVSRVDDARRAVEAGVTAISVSNHGGNNLDGTPGAIRMLKPIADAVGSDVEVLMDGGVRRGSDVVKALALGARAVMIGRAYLWGLGANGQAGVENVLDVLSMGVESTLLGLGAGSISELATQHLIVPEDFHRNLGTSNLVHR